MDGAPAAKFKFSALTLLNKNKLTITNVIYFIFCYNHIFLQHLENVCTLIYICLYIYMCVSVGDKLENLSMKLEQFSY